MAAVRIMPQAPVAGRVSIYTADSEAYLVPECPLSNQAYPFAYCVVPCMNLASVLECNMGVC